MTPFSFFSYCKHLFLGQTGTQESSKPIPSLSIFCQPLTWLQWEITSSSPVFCIVSCTLPFEVIAVPLVF